MPERDLTLAEVAELRRVTPRQLREFVRRHNIPILTTGKAIRFDAFALAALEEALRRPCRSKSSGGKTPAPSPLPASSGSPMARGGAYENALRLTTRDSRAKKPSPSKQKYSAPPGTAVVVPLSASRKP
jgi:hypothetical protein